MSKIILDTEDFFQNDGYDDLMHIDHESYCCGEMFEKYETKISDLEAKLAESKEEIKVIDEDRQFKAEMWTKFADKCKDLKQQLAEKDEEIEKSHLILDKILTEIHTNCYSGLNIVHFKEMALNDLGEVAITHNQDKISFAVEQLEKVKLYNRQRAYNYMPLTNYINNQIKQLTHRHEDKGE